MVMLGVLVVLLGCSAFFSGSETALMALSKLRLQRLTETMPGRARIVKMVLDEPERLIGTILLGNNLVNVAMSALATALALSLWGEKGIAYVTVILTLAILIFAEITPKVYAKYFDERVSLITAPILHVVMTVAHPIVVIVTYASTIILRLVGIDVKRLKRPLFTEAEIRTCINMAWDDGAISTHERKMLSRVFTLNDKSVEEIMVPQNRMAVLSINDPVEKIIAVIVKTGYSRFPVSHGKNGDIIGSIHAKDIFHLIDAHKPVSVKNILRPPYFISAGTAIDSQLRSFQALRLHQAVIRDSSGTTIGLITLEDILEELVGAIRDEHD